MNPEVSTMSSSELFKRATSVMQLERKSQVAWSGYDEDRRGALASVVRAYLLRLAEDPQSWLPSSLDPNGDEWIVIRFQPDNSVPGATLGKAVTDQRAQRRDRVVQDLLGLAEELGSTTGG